MEGTAHSRNGGMKSRISISFSGLLGGYPRIFQGTRSILREAEEEEGEETVEEEDLEETEVAASLKGNPEASEYKNLALSNQPLVSQAKTNFLKMMEQMTQLMGQLTHAASPRDNSRAPEFKTPSMKAPDSFDGTNALKLREFIQAYGKWIEPYLSNIYNEDPSYLLNSWKLFKTRLLTLFGTANEVRKAEKELDNLRMKEGGHVFSYITDFRSLMSRIGDWGERAYIHVYRGELASRILDQLPSHPCNYDSLQELMDITLELDTRYHECKKEKGSHQEKKPPVTGSNSLMHHQYSSSKKPHHKKSKKGMNFHFSKDKPHSALLNKDNKLIGSEKERRIKEGLRTYCGGKLPIGKCFKRPQNRQGL
ncbi:hypothetical protein O181_088662 [Austropuccinia psidii MF-1]|uniref:Retrotransposon gag domain-containing protein n=1 Tax=Austropuccinia psidii MF-1 TaxID=1389203 RepID=A0A9Q3P5H5_9BASI|nr:hypothetical protein [Austropuccinia psidii MF-1]